MMWGGGWGESVMKRRVRGKLGVHTYTHSHTQSLVHSTFNCYHLGVDTGDITVK